MQELNAAAADLLRLFEPNAVTDVTGFGLIGHAYEVASRSGVALRIDAASLPVLPGALELADQGVRTGGDRRNRDYVGGALTVERRLRGAGRARVRPADGRRAPRLRCPSRRAAGARAGRGRARAVCSARIGSVGPGAGVVLD